MGFVDPNTGLTGFTSIGQDSSEGSANYNAVQASVTKALTHGLSFQLSYTFSHSLDNGSSFEGSGFGGTNGRGYNQYQPSLNYGNSSFDARQRLVFAPIYISPILHGYNWYNPINLGLSGWEVTGITTVATGFPYDFTVGGSNSLWCSSTNSFYAWPRRPGADRCAPARQPAYQPAPQRSSDLVPERRRHLPRGAHRPVRQHLA